MAVPLDVGSGRRKNHYTLFFPARVIASALEIIAFSDQGLPVELQVHPAHSCPFAKRVTYIDPMPGKNKTVVSGFAKRALARKAGKVQGWDVRLNHGQHVESTKICLMGKA